jgi:zinc protease
MIRFRLGALALGLIAATPAFQPDTPAAQTAAPPAVAQAPAKTTSYAISDGRTPSGIRLVHMLLKDEKDQAFAMAWRDRLIQITPEKAALMDLGPQLLTVGGAGGLNGGVIEEEFKDLGASMSLVRGRVATLGQISAPKEQFEATAKLLRTVLIEPRLTPITLERGKRFLANNLKADRERAERLARDALNTIMVGKSAIAPTVTYAPPSVVTAVTVADVDAWRKAVLARGNLVVVSAGPLPREAAADLVDRTFGDLPERSEDRDPPAFSWGPVFGKTIVIEKQVPQTILLVGGPLNWAAGGAEGHSRAIGFSAFGSGGAGSRLFVAVREKLGAAYGASAGITPILGRQGIFAMQAAVSHDKAAPALAAMREEYRKFRETGVTQIEIDPIKRRMIAGLPDTMRRAGSAASTIRTGLQNGLPFDAADGQAASINAQTVEGINTLIRERLPETLATVIVAPSAEGLGADCVIKGLEELERCLTP